MQNTIIYLIGHQGVGKLTIGKQICHQTGAMLIDNHLIANPIFAAIANDPIGSIPEAIKEKIAGIRSLVFSAIVEDAPADLSYVLTDVLLNDASGRRRFSDVEGLVASRRARFLPVMLRCDDDQEYERRVSDPSRSALMKQTDLARSLKRRAERPLLAISHRDRLDLDVAPVSPEEAATLIVKAALTPR